MNTIAPFNRFVAGFFFISSPICLVYGALTGNAVFILKGIVVIQRATDPMWYALIMALHLIVTLACVRWLYAASTGNRLDQD